MKDFGDALDRIEDARKLVNLIQISCMEQQSGHLKAIVVACDVVREKMDDALADLEPLWRAECAKPEGGAA